MRLSAPDAVRMIEPPGMVLPFSTQSLPIAGDAYLIAKNTLESLSARRDEGMGKTLLQGVDPHDLDKLFCTDLGRRAHHAIYNSCHFLVF